MIDVRRLRVELEATKAALARKGVPAKEVERAATLDVEHRRLAREAEDLRGRVKALSKDVGDAMRAGEGAKAEALREESKQLGSELATVERESSKTEQQLRDALLRLPNLPAAEAPDGASEADNVVVRTIGYDPARYGPHQRVPHWDIGTELQILDMERGAKISGSMFSLFTGQGATLVRALCQLALDRNADAFTEVRPPSLVRTPAMEAVGQLPKFAEDAYHLERDDLWAIPTAEVPLTFMRANEILAEEELPLRLMAYTPCFRREAGAAGRDTRGLLRVHEFDKVEIVAICARADAPALHEELLERAAGALAALGLPYRVVDISTGDLGQSHARQFDIEVYAPGCDMWLEASSVSWFSDYQARRAAIRYRPARGGQTHICDTLNGSALAVPRVWAAVVETYRQPDGSVEIPDCLRPYFRGQTHIAGEGITGSAGGAA
ncbi:MAG TPA: serine--tRNA ligase [Acidimicrobiales bacterium]|nr:serine--tRNA ligase [Acidimicrobiales bacterium]